MSDNWVVQNLENALNTWNEKLAEIWQLITQSPQQFKGGTIWSVIVNIHGAVQAIGLALLVLFFVVGVVKTCGSFAEVIKSHHQTYLKKTQHNIDEVKDFQVIVETYFENLKQEMLNIKGSLKLAMVEFFITHKTDTESEFFISAMNGLKAPISEILLLGKKQGKISYDNLSDAADLVFYWQIGLEEIMLSTNVPMESLYSQIDLMKNMILSGHLD